VIHHAPATSDASIDHSCPSPCCVLSCTSANSYASIAHCDPSPHTDANIYASIVHCDPSAAFPEPYDDADPHRDTASDSCTHTDSRADAASAANSHPEAISITDTDSVSTSNATPRTHAYCMGDLGNNLQDAAERL